MTATKPRHIFTLNARLLITMVCALVDFSAFTKLMHGAQGGSDKTLGGVMLLAASVVFTYYTTWAMLLVGAS